MSTIFPSLQAFSLPLIATFLITFVLGSIPWGLIISKVFFRKDIRESGSGNIGTTNAMRTLGKVGGGAVFLLDCGKGILAGVIGLAFCAYALAIQGIPVIGWEFTILGLVQFIAPLDLLAGVLAATQWFTATAFLGCVLGHIFSPWLGGKGGKGIAVAVGCAFVTFGWWPTWILFGSFIVMTIVTRYVSIGSLVAAAGCPFIAFWQFYGNWYAVALSTAVGLIVIWAHRGNIKRLITHTENRIGKKDKSKDKT